MVRKEIWRDFRGRDSGGEPELKVHAEKMKIMELGKRMTNGR